MAKEKELPKGHFVGTIEQEGDAPLKVKYLIQEECIETPPEVRDVHAELSLDDPLWTKTGKCVIDQLNLNEEVLFSGCGDHVAMMSLTNPSLGILHFIYDASKKTLRGGDEFWEPDSPPSVKAKWDRDEVCEDSGEKSQSFDVRTKASTDSRLLNPAASMMGPDDGPSKSVLAARGNLAVLKKHYLIYDKKEHNDILSAACTAGHVDVAEFLLSKGPGILDHYYDALDGRNNARGAAIVKLLKEKIPCTEEVAAYASSANNILAVKTLMEYPPMQGSFSPALVAAAKNGNTAIVQYLLEQNVDPHEGLPFHQACKSGRLSVMRVIGKLVDCEEKDDDGRTPAEYLRIYGHDHLQEDMAVILEEDRQRKRKEQRRITFQENLNKLNTQQAFWKQALEKAHATGQKNAQLPENENPGMVKDEATS